MRSEWPTLDEMAEAYYLEHHEENDRQYREWCREQGLDPENVGSAIEWEQEVEERQEAAYWSSM